MEIVDDQKVKESEQNDSKISDSEKDGEGSETGVTKRVRQHRLNLYKQRQKATEPPVAKYLSDLVKNDQGRTAVVDKIKELVLVGW